MFSSSIVERVGVRNIAFCALKQHLTYRGKCSSTFFIQILEQFDVFYRILQNRTASSIIERRGVRYIAFHI